MATNRRQSVPLVFAGAIALAAGPAWGQGVLDATCLSVARRGVRIASVEPDLTLRLSDGGTVLLTGIDPVRNTAAHPRAREEARKQLSAWLEGRDAQLALVSPGPDRWGRAAGLISVASPGTGTAAKIDVALAMVDAGLARARPDPALHACWTAFLQAEAAARADKAGLWRDPAYAVIPAVDADRLAAATGGMAVVEGRVTRVSEGRYATFVRLDGPQADLTLRLDRSDAALLAASGLDLKGAIGTRVRARGFLDDRFGLTIRISSEDQIEVLHEGDAGPGNAGVR